MTLPADHLGPVALIGAQELVVQRLRRAIHLGHYRAGDRLLPERELAAVLGVSRVTLRGALHLLEQEGYIGQRGRGSGPAMVLPPGEPAQRLRRGLQAQVNDFEAVLGLRTALETESARLAAELRTEEDLGVMRVSCVAMADAMDVSEFRAADAAFHLAVARAAQNQMLYDAIEDTRARMFGPLDHVPFPLIIEPSLAGHRAVLSAIEAGAVDAAAEAMRDHLCTTRHEMRAVLGPQPSR